jgi:hypothetical protein
LPPEDQRAALACVPVSDLTAGAGAAPRAVLASEPSLDLTPPDAAAAGAAPFTFDLAALGPVGAAVAKAAACDFSATGAAGAALASAATLDLIATGAGAGATLASEPIFDLTAAAAGAGAALDLPRALPGVCAIAELALASPMTATATRQESLCIAVFLASLGRRKPVVKCPIDSGDLTTGYGHHRWVSKT